MTDSYDNPRDGDFPLLPGPPSTRGSPDPSGGGLRQARRRSNWSLAALIVGVGASTAALAHLSTTHTVPAGSVGSSQAGTGGQARSGHAPTANGPVAVTSGSQVVSGGIGGGGTGGSGGASSAAAGQAVDS